MTTKLNRNFLEESISRVLGYISTLGNLIYVTTSFIINNKPVTSNVISLAWINIVSESQFQISTV